MSKKKKSNLRSVCCNAKVKELYGFLGDTKEEASIHNYECTKCGKPCDFIVLIRKVWTINPKTKVIPNKKKDRMFSDKELKRFREEEDY